MDGKTRIKYAFSSREPDRVPLFEGAFSSRLASEILGRKVFIPSNGGSSFRHFLLARKEGLEVLEAAAVQSARDGVELYSKLGIDMIRVRITDFLTPVDFGYGNYGSNFIFNAEIQEINENRWRINGPDGFWSEHLYEPDSDAMMCVGHNIMEEGLAGFKRWVDFLEGQDTTLSEENQPGLAGVKASVEAAREAGVFVLGWGDVAYPGSSPYLTLFLKSMVAEKELIQRYMKLTTEGAVSFVRAQLEAGVDGIIGGNDWCFKSGPMFSPENFRDFFVPHLKRIVDLCHQYGVPYIKHLDGNTETLLDLLVDEVGIDGHHPFEPTAGMDIAKMKQRYRDRLTVIGNLDCGELLSNGTTQQVIDQTKKIIQEVSPGGGHIFSSSNSIHDAVKMENLYAMLDTVKKYGTYPISI